MTPADRTRAPAPRCWVCDAQQASRWKEASLDRPLLAEDLRITDSRYGTTLELWRCSSCDFIFAHDADIARLTALYSELEDPAYEEGEENRALQMRRLVGQARELHPDARTLLDVGAAAGLLVREATALGLEAEGVEPSESLAAFAARRGAQVHQGVLPHDALGSRRFDIVCLIDVIEHVGDPLRMLRDAAAMLAPGGVLALVTPDVRSVAARLLGRRWWHFRLAHVCYFDARSAAEAFERTGLRVRKQARAGWFFDVGYLAERMERYLPVGWLNRLVRGTPGVRSLYSVVIPLDLRDSFLFLLSRREDETA